MMPWIARAVGWAFAARRTWEMLKTVHSVVMAVALAVLATEFEARKNGEKGEAKKNRARKLLFEAVDPWLPDYLNPVIRAACNWLIEAAVSGLLHTGAFNLDAIVEPKPLPVTPSLPGRGPDGKFASAGKV